MKSIRCVDKTHGGENKEEFHMAVAKYPFSRELSAGNLLASLFSKLTVNLRNLPCRKRGGRSTSSALLPGLSMLPI